MKKVSTHFLRVAVVFIGLPILALCIFFVPALGRVFAEMVPSFAFIKYFIFLIFYGSTIPFYYALYQAMKLLGFIDKGAAFSQWSVEALKKVKVCAVLISGLHLLILPLFYVFAELDDAPGVIFVGLVVPFASMVIAVFAAVLQRLLQDAIFIKAENDLTV